MSDSTRFMKSNTKRGRSQAGVADSGGLDDASQASKAIVEDKSTPPLETPRVLTRGVVNSLTHGLDASDVIECYALVRSAPLHGIANSSITVQKMTIGIRFRPTAADLKNPYNVKTPMELTLEYGPARLGPLLSDEATPIVQGNDESSSYLAWDNAGKVYFTQKIVTENFLSSHYMASMTGAVLNKLLIEAVEYTEVRKIYQPFAVYSENGKRRMRSSSSADFTWFVWSHLAKLGVEIEPILPPAMYEARLYTKSVTKVFPDQVITRAAATFYQRLYNCLESIATNNYGSFLSSKEQPTTGEEDESISSNTGNGNDRYLISTQDALNDYGSIRSDDLDEEKIRRLEEEAQETEVPDDVNEETNEEVESSEIPENLEIEESQGEEDDVVKNSSKAPVANEDEETDDSLEDEGADLPGDASNLPSDSLQPFSDQSSSSEIITPETTEPTEEPSSDEDDTAAPTEDIQDVEKAQNAANDAQKAADEAKIAAQTEGQTKAADAAQAAADAALAAADATSSAASQAAMDSLLSGDGAMMTSIISTCFSNPRYEISSPDSNKTAPTEIYLFRDPSTYYKLELISPYLEITKLNRPLPNAAAILSDYGTGGDALDWTLAMLIFSSMLLMVLLICQQMGKPYVRVIYKCQRWFFDPLNRGEDEEEELSGVQSGSHFFFGKAGIPVSMGGKQSSYSPLKTRESLEHLMVNEGSFLEDDGDDSEQGMRPLTPTPTQSTQEFEMVNFGPDSRKRLGRGNSRESSRFNSGSSDSSSEDDELPATEIPDRLLRNPDLVELPSLKSKSKVAMPVGSSSNASSPYLHSRSASTLEGSMSGLNLSPERAKSETIL